MNEVHGKVAYVCGPMHGLYDLNMRMFEQGVRYAQKAGHVTVINPAQRWELAHSSGMDWPTHWRTLVTEMLQLADVVYALPGCFSSRYSKVEIDVAKALSIPIINVPMEEEK